MRIGWAAWGFMTRLIAGMTYDVHGFLFTSLILHRKLKSGMHMFTFGTLWAEPTHVIQAENSPDMSMSAAGTMLAESSIIPRAVFYFRLGINVKILAFLVATFPKLGVKVAFRHLCHVVLMKKFALVSLLAKTSQPVLTHDCLFTFSMSKGTERPSVAHIPHEILTNCCSRLVHSRERKRLHSNLVVHLSLYLELEIRHASYDFLHFRKKQQR